MLTKESFKNTLFKDCNLEGDTSMMLYETYRVGYTDALKDIAHLAMEKGRKIIDNLKSNIKE